MCVYCTDMTPEKQAGEEAIYLIVLRDQNENYQSFF